MLEQPPAGGSVELCVNPGEDSSTFSTHSTRLVNTASPFLKLHNKFEQPE